jgi:hypothetical protein
MVSRQLDGERDIPLPLRLGGLAVDQLWVR